MKRNKVEICTCGDSRFPSVSVRVDDQPVDITARVNGKPIDEDQLLDLVHYAGMVHAVSIVERLDEDEKARFFEGVMEG